MDLPSSVSLIFNIFCFSEETLNSRPIVGILAQELSYSLMEIFANKTSYIGAAYVKYIEAAGARVVPVLINQVSFFAISSFIQPLKVSKFQNEFMKS